MLKGTRIIVIQVVVRLSINHENLNES